MRNPIGAARAFLRTLGPVEQAQMVASTAVVVSMATILSAMLLTGQPPRLMDFISILTVGTIGFTSVYFSLQYSRQLDEQRRQLLALYTIAETVNVVAELEVVLQTALDKISEMLRTPYGWVYLREGNALALRCARGTSLDFFTANGIPSQRASTWLHQPRVERESVRETPHRIGPALRDLGVRFWASIPLRTKEAPAGTLIVAGAEFEMFTPKQAELLEAFGNQMSVAISNARLFERLRASERQFADLFENAPDIYLTVDRRHVVVACNTTGAGFLGRPKDLIIGRQFEVLFGEDRRTDLHGRIENMFEAGKPLRDIEEQMLTTGGTVMHVALNSSLLVDERGSVVHARIVARDISERKRMEAALLHAQKIDSIGNLAGGIAHDFNNILSAILGSASIMRRHLAERSRLGKYVEIVESSARRGSSLTRQLLTFARKTETFIKPVDCNALVTETLHLFERSVTKEIDLRTDLSTEPLIVNGDEGQIQQALLNLLLNARDAMPAGGILTVSTRPTVADASTSSRFSSVRPGPFVLMRVSDTGKGMSREMQNRVFEPFYTTKDHGTGLGLSVVYGVVQSHGGFVDLESEPGRGTTFAVYLPRVAASIHAPSQRRRAPLPHGTEGILIIEDEVSVAEIARDMLSGLGYTVFTARNGLEGVEFYRMRRASVDLILLDINMPILGGKDAFEQLRTISPDVRIIIVTGYGKGTIETSSFSSRINAFMQKPFQLETMALTVREVLDRKSLHPQKAV
jgi:PAS domain S-box-containing protein